MKIVLLSAFLHPYRSGAEACAEEVSLALHGQYDMVIITARMRRDLPVHDMLKDSVPVHRVGFGYPMIDKWLYPVLAPLAARRYRPEKIHAILETFAGLALVLCSWILPRAKRILTCQTTNRRFLKSWIIRSADIVTCISTPLLEQAHRLGRNDAIHIPNGVDVGAMRNAMTTEKRVQGRVLFVGRLEHMKGVDTLLTAFSQLVQRDHSKTYTLRIVGDGSLKLQLAKQVSSLHLQDVVSFAGYLSTEDVSKEYAEAEVFCALSRSEALGNVFLEAQAAGCAVVGTSVGGIPDIIEQGRTGILVPPNDPHSAMQAMMKLFSDDSLREHLAEAGRGSAERFDWQVVTKQYADVYERA